MRQFIIYLLMVSFITTTSAFNVLVMNTCLQMFKMYLVYNTDVQFCVNALNSDPRSSNATNRHQLAEISFEMDISKAKSIPIIIDNLLKNTTQEKSLDDCKAMYSFAVVELTAGLEALKAKNYERAIVFADSAVQRAKICQLGLRKHMNMTGVSSLARGNTYFMHLASISASFHFPHN
ncbi:hypothetical protein RND81_14G214300 [Saponaria officinalis]|uniref:Pectinesterase inhibitor domain-containing protein n=1 Tax=Saponaria officinalis TaxID=3572 RepID=A0AAW1GQN9_SAPOF